MGSKLPAVDILLVNYMKPMITAYNFGHYEVAAKDLFFLNMFLNGYGEGVELKMPQSRPVGIHQRQRPDHDFKIYYERNCGAVMKALGLYIREVLDSFDRKGIPHDYKTQERESESITSPMNDSPGDDDDNDDSPPELETPQMLED
jgi:hypothetical protein